MTINALEQMETERDLVKEAMQDYWGEKCPEYEDYCGCCIAWKQFEELKQKGKTK